MKKLLLSLIFTFGLFLSGISENGILNTANAQYDNVIGGDSTGGLGCAGIGCEISGDDYSSGGGSFDLFGLFDLFDSGDSWSAPAPTPPPAPLPIQPEYPTPIVMPNFVQPTVIEQTSACPSGTIFCGPGIRGGADLTKQNIDQNIYTDSDLKRLMIAWTRFLYPIIAILAVIAIIYAGFLYVTAFGDDAKTETAKKVIMWVAIGIVLVLGAFAAVNTVITKIL